MPHGGATFVMLRVSFRVNVENVNLMLRFEIYTSLYEYEMRRGIRNVASRIRGGTARGKTGRERKGTCEILAHYGIPPLIDLGVADTVSTVGGKIAPLPRS